MRIKLVILLVLGFGMAYLTFSLGQWQTRRGDEKQAIADMREAAFNKESISPSVANVDLTEGMFRKVALSGHYMEGSSVLLDNRQWNGRPAVQWLEAFKVMPAGYVVMVDRGYLLRNPAKPRELPLIPDEKPTNDQETIIIGRLLSHFDRAAELWGLRVASSEEIHQDGMLWSNFDVASYEKMMNVQLGNFVIQAIEEKGLEQVTSEIKRSEFKNSSDVAKHRGYAFQWYGLTAVLLILTLWLAYKEHTHAT